MRLFRSLLLSTTVLSASVATAEADINVVASIKPVHSLVAAVMEGVGTPDLIVDGAGSPHTYALKPSQAGNLQNADLVFWIGDRLETFLEKPIESIATKAKSVTLIESHGLNQLKFREGGAFDSHDHEHDEHGHDDHGHDDHAEDKHDDHGHDDHAKDKHDDHGHDDHAEDKHDDHGHDDHAEDKHDDHGHDDHGHDDHGHDGYDPHVWLDPVNAKALVHEIEEALSDADPANAGTYEANATALMGRLDALVEEVQTELNPVKGRGFVVFHDAYQHFDTRFGISAIGSVTVSPEVMPGAERIRELQEKVNSLDASCVFSEPQFEPKLVSTVTENTNAGTGVLDPLGASIPDGPGLYFTLIRNMASALKECLSGKG
ncbi:MAG: zinc ABC transporter substrate-binding protein [Pseudomonadota bacterium]|nr:zinc ABC transporter substrate-binding protein [Pseudomonadota bacterium]